ncbi:MAG: NAD-dependent epimerase [Bacteroidales bacterium]|nr:NAD-dependent epimerase [Bacteroidales bacterium]
MKVLVTGTAGFIGFHLAKRLVERGDEVVGIDCINDYYDVNLKYSRLKIAGIEKDQIEYGKPIVSKTSPNYSFIKLNLEDKGLNSIFKQFKFDRVCNLAAQAGVRYSMENPFVYAQSNIVGFINILEACRDNQIEHLVYASSSSVYGLNETMPFSTSHNVDHPISLYAASKKSNELMAHTYSYLYGIPTTGLRFFTVYGPWGRPDMALFLFTKAILEGKPIDVFNDGNMQRDFTYIDDIVEGVVRVIDDVPIGNPNWSGAKPDPSSSVAPYQIYNIGNSSPVKLMDFIKSIEESLGKKAQMNLMPLQPGDVPATWANVDNLWEKLNFKPNTAISEGISRFVVWYKQYYGVR